MYYVGLVFDSVYKHFHCLLVTYQQHQTHLIIRHFSVSICLSIESSGEMRISATASIHLLQTDLSLDQLMTLMKLVDELGLDIPKLYLHIYQPYQVQTRSLCFHTDYRASA